MSINEKNKVTGVNEGNEAVKELFVELDEYSQAIQDAEDALAMAEEELEEEMERKQPHNAINSEQFEHTSRIKKIIVRQLFGLYDYDIDIDHRYSILHSMNGKGKTTILKLIKAVIELDLVVLDITPFKSFSLILSGEKTIQIEKQAPNESFLRNLIQSKAFYDDMRNSIVHSSHQLRNNIDIIITLRDNTSDDVVIQFSDDKDDLLFSVYNAIRDTRNGRYTWKNDVEEIKDQIDISIRRTNSWRELFDTIREFTNRLECTFIEANRIKIPSGRRRYGSSSSYEERTIEREYATDEHVEQCGNKLAGLIRRSRMKYLQITEQLNMSFPQRAMEAMANKGGKYSRKHLIDQMDDLDSKRREYEKYGLLPNDNENIREEIKKFIPQECSQDMLAMLEVFVHDYTDRLHTVEKIYEDIKLFIHIINDEHRFTDKKLIVQDRNFERKETSVFFKGKNGNDISLRQLSSGEKNDFILFYEMIFGTNNNTLLLMDEPEISTHISWQIMFSDEVARICEQTGMQVIVATHSPNIVSGFEDNVIMLGEVE